MEEIILIAGAIAWLTTTLVAKDGPFNIFDIFRTKTNNLFGILKCFHCTSFWVGLLVIGTFYFINKEIIEFFGLIGLAQALRGMSQEWN